MFGGYKEFFVKYYFQHDKKSLVLKLLHLPINNFQYSFLPFFYLFLFIDIKNVVDLSPSGFILL